MAAAVPALPRANFNVLPYPEVPCRFYQKGIVRIVAACVAPIFALAARFYLHDKLWRFSNVQVWTFSIIHAALISAPTWLFMFPAWKDPSYQKERRQIVGRDIRGLRGYKTLLSSYKREWESGIFTKDDLRKEFLNQINSFGFQPFLRTHTLDAVEVWDTLPFPQVFWDAFKEYVQLYGPTVATIKSDYAPIWHKIPGLTEDNVDALIMNFLRANP